MWGRLLGALIGLAMFRLLGLIVGFAVGYWFDRSLKQSFEQAGGFQGFGSTRTDAQGLFMYSTFAVMGHVAKADGVVRPAHIAQATAFMQQLGLDAAAQQQAQQAFREGKAPDFALQKQLQELRQLLRWRPDLLQMFLEIQISVAFVDGSLSQAERRLLEQVAAGLSVPSARLAALIAKFAASSRFNTQDRAVDPAQQQQAARELLGLNTGFTMAQLKKAYKKQMAQHHPDKLVSQGLPPEMLKLANEKSAQIQAAYELLKQQHG